MIRLWGVASGSWRSIATGNDLLPGETLVEGEPPEFPPDYIAEAEAQRAQLFALANAAINPLQDAVDLDMATEAETVALLCWHGKNTASF